MSNFKIHFITVLYTRWRFIIILKPKFYIQVQKKIIEKFVKLCLHSSYAAHDSFHFDDFFKDILKFIFPYRNQPIQITRIA